MAAGRRPATGDLGLRPSGSRPAGSSRSTTGCASLRAEGEWLYAVGDCNGRAPLTHMGKYQARIAADVIFGKDDPGPLEHRRRSARHVHRSAGQRGRADDSAGAGARLRVRTVEYGTGDVAGASTHGTRRRRDEPARRRRGRPPDRRRDVHRPGHAGAPARRDDRDHRPACPSTSCGTPSPHSPPSARSGCACSRPTGSDEGCVVAMPDVGFGNLFAVALVAFGVPLLLGLAPWLRVPGPVLEIVAGVVLGPAVLGWVDADLPVRVLAVVGLAFLLFLAGLEIDVSALRGRPLRLALTGFAITLALGVLAGGLFAALGWVQSALLLAVTLSATSLGLVVPVLKDAGQTEQPVGQAIVVAASVADVGAVLLLSLFFSTRAGNRYRCARRAPRRLRAGRRRAGVGAAARRPVSASRGGAAAAAGHHRGGTRAGVRRAPARARRGGVTFRPGDDSRSVRRRRRPRPRRPRRHVAPTAACQARRRGLRLRRPDLLRRQRPAARRRGPARRRGRAGPCAGVPRGAARRPGRCGPPDVADRGRSGDGRGRPAAGDVPALHPDGHPNRGGDLGALPGDRRRARRGGTALRTHLPGHGTRPAAPSAVPDAVMPAAATAGATSQA